MLSHFFMPSFLWVCPRYKTKSKVQERDRSKNPEGSEATSTVAQQRETGLNPKWVWLFGFSNFCLP